MLPEEQSQTLRDWGPQRWAGRQKGPAGMWPPKWKVGGTSFSHGLFIFLFCCCCLVAQLCPILCDSMDGNHQAPLSMGFLRQEHWGGLPCPSPGVFLTQISNQHRMFGRWILYHWTIWEAHFSVSTPCIPFKSVVKSLPISLWEFREWRKMFFFNFYWSIADLWCCVTLFFLLWKF